MLDSCGSLGASVIPDKLRQVVNDIGGLRLLDNFLTVLTRVSDVAVNHCYLGRRCIRCDPCAGTAPDVGGSSVRCSRRAARSRVARFFAASVAAALAALVLVGCGGNQEPARSVKKFCSTYNSEKAQFLSRYGSVGKSNGGSPTAGSALTDLLLGLQSLGDVTVIFTKLEKVAPDEIEPDMAVVLDSWKGMQGTLGDEASNALNPKGMIGVILKGLVASAQSNGSWTRVSDYIQHNCLSGS